MKLEVSFCPQSLNVEANPQNLYTTTGFPVAKGEKGDKGDDGDTPLVEVTPITGGNNVAFVYGDGDPRNTDFNVLDGVADDESIADIRARQIVAPTAEVKRVGNATEIVNPIWLDKAAIQFGCSVSSNKFYIFLLFVYTGAETFRSYYLTEKDSTNEPYEFTLENAPIVRYFDSDRQYNAVRLRGTLTEGTFTYDLRTCIVVYGDNGEEIERIYSAQYRYVVENGIITRTLVPTQATSRTHIIDLGIMPNLGSLDLQYNSVTYENLQVNPLTTDYYESRLSFHIPDSVFENLDYGVRLLAKRGDGAWYKFANVFKAEDPIDISQYRTASDQDVIDANQNTTLYNYVNTEISALDAEDVGLTEISAVDIAAILQS